MHLCCGHFDKLSDPSTSSVARFWAQSPGTEPVEVPRNVSSSDGVEMDSSSPEWRSYFATVADSYDRLQPVLSPPYGKGLDMLVELIPFDADDAFEFVDLGCGTAEPTVRVLEHFRHATGTCIDSEPEMLALARRKLTPYSDRVKVREADITSCDIQPCDLVFSAKTIHHVPPGWFARTFCPDCGRTAAGWLLRPVRCNVSRPPMGSRCSAASVALPPAASPRRRCFRGSYSARD